MLEKQGAHQVNSRYGFKIQAQKKKIKKIRKNKKQTTKKNGELIRKIHKIEYRMTQARLSKIVALYSAPCYRKGQSIIENFVSNPRPSVFQRAANKMNVASGYPHVYYYRKISNMRVYH